MMAMEDLPLMQSCCNTTTETRSSYVSWTRGDDVSEDGEAIDSISVYSGRYGRFDSGERGAIVTIFDAIAQMFSVLLISPADIDCVADVIDEATQQLAVELTGDKTETTGFEVQTM